MMDHVQRDVAETLSEAVCWERLRKTSVGRLAIVNDGQPEIYPVNYIVDGTSLVFRTSEGTKLANACLLTRVAMEIDGYEQHRGEAWSILLKGRARLIDGFVERDHAADLPLFPWVQWPKPAFVRIVCTQLTGRRFRLEDGIVTDSSLGWPDQVGNAHRSSAV